MHLLHQLAAVAGPRLDLVQSLPGLLLVLIPSLALELPLQAQSPVPAPVMQARLAPVPPSQARPGKCLALERGLG